MEFRSFEDFHEYVRRLSVEGGALTRQVEELDSEIEKAEQALAGLRANRANIAMHLQDAVAEQDVGFSCRLDMQHRC